jgi:hypothetical protein
MRIGLTISLQIMYLESTITDIHHVLQFLRNNLTPFHRIPAEIVCQIFGFVQDTAADSIAEAFRLSQVCPRWRNIANSYSRLWSNISISEKPLHIEAYKECINRSARHALTMRISGLLPVEPGRSNKALKILSDLLKEHSVRIQHIEAEISKGRWQMLPVIIGSVLPNLKSFKYCSDVQQIRALLPGDMCGGNLKKLRVLDLTNVIIRSELIKFRGLTSIRLASTTDSGVMLTDEFFNLLINCPRVKSLELARYVFRDTADGTRPPIPLHSLKNLSFVSADSRFLLSHIDAPSINHLSINGTGLPLPASGLNPVLPDDISTLNFTGNFTSLIIFVESLGFSSSTEEIDNFHTRPSSFVVQSSMGVDAFIPIFHDILFLTLHNVTLLSLNRGYSLHQGVKPVTSQMMMA